MLEWRKPFGPGRPPGFREVPLGVFCYPGVMTTTAAEIERVPLVARRETDGVVVIVARNQTTGQMERVEIAQEHLKQVRRRLKRFTWGR